jgi:hypothetical protein
VNRIPWLVQKAFTVANLKLAARLATGLSDMAKIKTPARAADIEAITRVGDLARLLVSTRPQGGWVDFCSMESVTDIDNAWWYKLA